MYIYLLQQKETLGGKPEMNEISYLQGVVGTGEMGWGTDGTFLNKLFNLVLTFYKKNP